MAISGDQVMRKVIPDLIDKGLIRTIKRIFEGKTQNYYILDFNAINNYDGSAMDPKVEQTKRSRAQKAYNGRRMKEADIMMSYGPQVSDLITSRMSIDDREMELDHIANEISQRYNYQLSTAKVIINKMLIQYRSGKTPDWFIAPDEEDDELPF